MQKTAFLSIFAILVSSSIYANDFDSVVFNDQVVTDNVPLGFGGLKLLDLIEHEAVRPMYEELRSLGKIEVSVQKLEPQNDGETKTTRFTFVAWRQTGFTSREKAGTLIVDRYSLLGMMDASPDRYRVVR